MKLKQGLEIKRNDDGVMQIFADSESLLYYGMGYCHAKDRGLQMLLMRIIGQGRLSEILDSSEESLLIDIFFRRMNWQAEISLDGFTEEVKTFYESYCRAINDVFESSLPWELKLLGYRHEAWQITDSILLSRMMGYIGLSGTQAEIEKLFLEMLQAGISIRKLEELFPGLLQEADLELLQKIKLEERLVTTELWQKGISRFIASNNWVVASCKSKSGKPLLANDPHLEINRLPAVWYEQVAHWQGNYVVGATVPGLPGVIIGRSKHLSWGVTYTFMDAIDSWVEKCKDGKYYREGEGWLAFQERQEVILRKKKQAHTITVYENQHGILQGNPYEEGYYLASNWSGSKSGLATFSEVGKILHAQSVEEGMDVMGNFETAWNFVFADAKDNIGYQMSGLLPKRRSGWKGFVPLTGWLAENDWQGFHSYQDLPRAYNPPQGYFVTANNDLNAWGKVEAINMPHESYRADRISQLLEEKEKLDAEDMKRMQYDVYSLQAEKFIAVLRQAYQGKELSQRLQMLFAWDCCYTTSSQEAYCFELFYKQLHLQVFGKGGMGEETIQHLLESSGIFVDFYGNFDAVMLAEESEWFSGLSRAEIYQQAWQKVEGMPLQNYGEMQRLEFTHILFDGRLPRFLGFDKGPYALPGGRSTINQGQIYTSEGRKTSFFPSIRVVADMAEDGIQTNLPGGVSDRRFSRWYCSDLQNWLDGNYKKLL
ncbi:MAG: penicillin acylase family protein [Spirochaetota bacterium]